MLRGKPGILGPAQIVLLIDDWKYLVEIAERRMHCHS
jgi:hypothetical protein